ncbi:MAG: 16S rRNA (guanine(966)-N(2))-methyltransferase RsmD [Bacteroidia bacterium]
MIRIISGTLKGRKIKAPDNLPVRPTTDFAKEALFNILNNRVDFESIRVLDLFSGTGNISYELASRGCPDITCVEKDERCARFIITTAREFSFSGIHVIKTDVFRFLESANGKWDLIFADPPYEMKGNELLPGIIMSKALLNPEGILIIEHSERQKFTDTTHLLEHRKYGKVNFSIFGYRNV